MKRTATNGAFCYIFTFCGSGIFETQRQSPLEGSDKGSAECSPLTTGPAVAAQ
jgi:hypothetical protein